MWLAKVVTTDFHAHRLNKCYEKNDVGYINYFSKYTIGDADHKLFSQIYDTTAIDTNIILGHNLFEYDIAKIMQTTNERYTKNIYADVLKYDVIQAGLADGAIRSIDVVTDEASKSFGKVVDAPAGYTKIAVSELNQACKRYLRCQ